VGAHWTDDEVRDLVEQARSEAREEVLAVLRRRFSEELLSSAVERGSLPPARRGDAPRRGAPLRDDARRLPSAAAPQGREREEHAPLVAAPVPDGDALWYVFGVAEAVPGLAVPEPAFVGEGESFEAPAGPVRLAESAGLVALTVPVAPEVFGDGALQARVEDMAWLQDAARWHESVLAAVGPAGLVPFRLATVFASRERVTEMLVQRAVEFRAALARVAGHVELGVKAFATEEVLRSLTSVDDSSVAALQGEGEGVGYLQRRSAERRGLERAQGLAVELGQDLHEAVAELAADSSLGRLHSSEVSGEEGWMLLNGSYLVPLPRVPVFHETVDRLAERLDRVGVRAHVTGPWPPYHFVGDAESA
jgi:hypothetical protein